MILRCDIDATLVIDSKTITHPAFPRSACRLVFRALTVEHTNRMDLTEVSVYRRDITMFGSDNQPTVIRHIQAHHGPRHFGWQLKLLFLHNG